MSLNASFHPQPPPPPGGGGSGLTWACRGLLPLSRFQGLGEGTVPEDREDSFGVPEDRQEVYALGSRGKKSESIPSWTGRSPRAGPGRAPPRSARRGSGARRRVVTEDQNMQKQTSHELIFKHFRANKVEIASAITRPFPFLMSLRDRAFISEQKYEHFQETCRNLVPVTRVAYDVLSELEKTFDLSLLKVLFSKTNLKAYPDLNDVLKSFQKVSWGLAVQIEEREESEEAPTLLSYNGEETCDPRTLWMAKEKEPERVPSLTPVSCDPEAHQVTNKEAAEDKEALSQQPPCTGQGYGELEEQQMHGEVESGELTSSPLQDGRGAEDSACENEKCSCVMCYSKEVPEGSAANMSSGQACDTRGYGELEEQQMHGEVESGELTSSPLQDGRGAWKRSIQTEDQKWLSPREFEIAGGYAPSKKWKLSVRCQGWPLEILMEEGYLPVPPSKRGKLKNSDECEVCRKGGTLFCCDTCSRAFHEDCHIPLVEAEMDPWSCIFCRMESSLRQQGHRESEVLKSQMQAEEQLKCEFILLKVYCCSESSFFAKIPYYYYIKETSQVPKEPMWLDKIRNKLHNKGYTQVEGFVQDMRLIFWNHRISYKDQSFGQMGLRLEAEFENTFKEVFAIEETSDHFCP
ncbi:nuclear body protein SP140-like protein [Ctenodactylus gundi]